MIKLNTHTKAKSIETSDGSYKREMYPGVGQSCTPQLIHDALRNGFVRHA